MGQKVHPVGFRLGITRDWQSRWFAERGYTNKIQEDLAIRQAILKSYSDAGICLVEIDRNANQVTVTVHTAKPGIVIGRGGSRVDELRSKLEKLTGKRVRVNIQELRQPELDAYLVARNVADQLQRRIAFRRAAKQAVSRAMQRGAEGVKITVAGRLGGAEMSRSVSEREGRVPLHTLRAYIDYGFAEAKTTFGIIGVKAWIYKGDVLPAERAAEVEVGEDRPLLAQGGQQEASPVAVVATVLASLVEVQASAGAERENPSLDPSAAAEGEVQAADEDS